MDPRLPFLLIPLLLFCGTATAGEMHLGGHFQDHEEFRMVIDARCIGCHTRERIERARREGRELQPIQSRMVERGALLSERDKKVLGTFWGTPLKEKESSLPDPALPSH